MVPLLVKPSCFGVSVASTSVALCVCVHGSLFVCLFVTTDACVVRALSAPRGLSLSFCCLTEVAIHFDVGAQSCQLFAVVVFVGILCGSST
jgi:hypothetical protein